MIMLSQLLISNGLNSLDIIIMKKMLLREKMFLLNRFQQLLIMAMNIWELLQDWLLPH